MPQHQVEIAEQRAAAGEHDPLVDDVGGKFGAVFSSATLTASIIEPTGSARLSDICLSLITKVAPPDLHQPAFAVFRHAGGADLLLDPLGAAFSDEEIMVAANVGNDRLVHLVAADPNRSAIDEAAKRQYRHLGRPASDIDDHRAGWLGHRKTGTDACCHRKGLPCARTFSRFPDRAPLHRGRARGYTDDDLRRGEAAAVERLADEILDHFLRYLEIGDDAVAQRSDCLNVAKGAADH
jgi:hypothetical protein